MRFLGALVVLTAAALSAHAAEVTTQQFGNWNLVCADGAAKPEECHIVQEFAADINLWAKVQVRFDEGRPVLWLIVPPEARHRRNIGVKYGRIQGVVRLRCDENQCKSDWGLGKETIDAIIETGFLSVEFATAPQEGIGLTFFTSGLKAALDAVPK